MLSWTAGRAGIAYWLINGVSSGFGRELTQQLLDHGHRVVGTVRDTSKVTALADKHPATFIAGVAARGHHRHQPHRLHHAHPLHPAAPAGQGGGRIIQISSYGGQVAFPGNSLYRATKWGIEGFCDAVAHEVAPFGIGETIAEPGGARTEFRYGSARVANLMPEYDATPAHAFQRMLDPANGLAPGDPTRMAARIIDSFDT